MKRVLVTGAAGFIGSNLMYYLAEQRPQWQLIGLDSLTYAGNLETLSPLIEARKVQFEKADITDTAAMEKLFSTQKVDLVFHLAAESHVDRSIMGAAEFVKTNVLGTQILLSAARQHGVSRFVHISTDEVYGSLGPTGRFTETTPLDPTSPYASSKASSDLMVLACAKTHGFDAVVTRCTNNYGSYQFPEKLIPLFITNALDDVPLPLYGDGMNVRSWVYVTDHCEGLLRVAEGGRPGEIYNIGGDESAEIPNVQVTKMILEQLGKPTTLIKRVADRPAHDRRYAVDFSKIRSELGWQPRVPFADGLARTIEWYISNRAWWERVKSGAYRAFYEANYAHR